MSICKDLVSKVAVLGDVVGLKDVGPSGRFLGHWVCL
jgi:hypothetical protein